MLLILPFQHRHVKPKLLILPILSPRLRQHRLSSEKSYFSAAQELDSISGILQVTTASRRHWRLRTHNVRYSRPPIRSPPTRARKTRESGIHLRTKSPNHSLPHGLFGPNLSICAALSQEQKEKGRDEITPSLPFYFTYSSKLFGRVRD